MPLAPTSSGGELGAFLYLHRLCTLRYFLLLMPYLPFLLLLSRCGGRLELILICLGSLVFLQMALPLVGQVVVVGVAVVVGVIFGSVFGL
jgi:hypothetical protein